MKKLLFVAAASACCILFSCNHFGGGGDDTSNSKNLSIIHDVYKGIETGDTSKLSSIAPDAIDHMGPNGDVKGGDSVKHMLADMHNHIKDLKIDIMQEATNGDYAFVLSKLTGTVTDNSMGMPAGTPYMQTGVDVIRFKDGKTVEHWGYVDPMEMMKMMQQQQPMPTMKTDSSGTKK